ncbi:MAG: hypothetical protein PHI29_01550 [Gallionella sp.]|nr:hypothetical protein [Gallionella sp.]
MTIAPLEKATTLINTINAMVENGVDHSKLSYVRSEAQKLEDIGMFVDAKRVKGMIATLEWDIESVHSQFLAAVRASGKEFFTCANYASALSNIGDLKGAIDWIDQVVAMAPDNKTVVEEAIRMHLEAFDVAGTQRLVLHLKNLGGSINIERELTEKSDLLASYGVTWYDIAERVKLASSLIGTQNNVAPRGRHSYLHDGVIIFRFLLHSSVEDALAAESRMLAALAEIPFSNVDKFLYLSCDPV